MTAAAVAGDRARIGFVDALRESRDSDQARPLADIVGANLRHLWEHGGRLDSTGPGRQPEWIHIRTRFVLRPPAGGPEPALARLVKSKGLQLRLLLLMLFDAQCRYGPGDTVRNVRWVAPHPNEDYASWRQLVLSETMRTAGTGRGHGDLRARQITEAMRALEEEHLLWLPRQPGGTRRRYDPKDGVSWHLLSEASTAEEHPRYALPTPETSIRISPLFFTNLWVFALSDVELAAYLALAYLRTRFPGRHAHEGVFLLAEDRENQFRLTRTAWRATELLHRFRLVDRAPDPRRNFRTGNVGARDTRWANRQVMPALFTVNDAALQRPALDAIHQVLTAPTAADDLRREKGQKAVDEAIAAGLL
ncbi:hypothetical protein [Micromonospora sp. NPDC004551]|uniref:hypothetical protein n=1 Tax=Micromonospora sp. NPDC004551 TaxID=3154284 RepID=UPI0033AEA64B